MEPIRSDRLFKIIAKDHDGGLSWRAGDAERLHTLAHEQHADAVIPYSLKDWLKVTRGPGYRGGKIIPRCSRVGDAIDHVADPFCNVATQTMALQPDAFFRRRPLSSMR